MAGNGSAAEERLGPSLARLRRLANAQRFSDLEAAWLDALAEGGAEAADLVPIAGQVGRLGEAAKAAALLELLLGTVEERAGAAAALAAARQGAVELPEAVSLRTTLPRLYSAAHPADPDLAALMRRVFAAERPLPEVVDVADAYLRLRPGAFLRDSRYLDPGVVEKVEPGTGDLTARFGERRQAYTPDEVPRITILPEEHFRALLLYQPDRLREIATARPVAYARLALDASKDGTLAYRDLKTQITGLLGEKGWTVWWGEARVALRRDPRIEVSGGSQPTFRLLAAERRYDDRVREEFAALTEPLERLRLVLGYIDGAGVRHPADPDLLAHFGNAVARQAMALLPADPILALACLAVHAAIAARGAAVPRPGANAAAQVLGRIADPGQLARRLDERLLREVLDYVRTTLPERWAGVWSVVLPRAGRRLGEALARELADDGRLTELEFGLRETVEHPTAAPDMLCWLWRARRTPRFAPVLAGMPSLGELEILYALLTLADATGRLCAVSDEDRHHRVLSLVQQALAGPGGLPVRELAAAGDAAEARRLKAAIVSNGGLATSGRHELLAYVRAAHPEVFAETEKPWEEDVIYTTPAGLERRRQEFEDLVKVALPAVAKQIGEAAAHGDLSENAEYKAALEKRDLITSRATHIESELARARLITPDLPASPFVNVGTRVRAREEGAAQEMVFTFLGPWEADPERHVLNYNAPLALAFMGRAPGDTVVFGDPPEARKFQVLAVEPAL